MNINKIKQETPAKKISYFQSIDSTNNYLLMQGGCGEICISDMQSAGRGRRGNTWVSPNTGNLYFSLCWCFEKRPKFWSLLGLDIGIAIAETLDELGLKNHGIKWPNDIFWQQRKMGGILIETLNQSRKVVIGIGLNLKMTDEEQKQIDQAVVPLEEALFGKNILKEDLIVSLVKKLYQHLEVFEKIEFEAFIRSWNRWDILSGETVSVKHQGLDILGVSEGIDSHGRLKFRKEGSDDVLLFSSADIKLRSLNKI